MTNIVTLNNKSIRNLRKEKVYQAVIIDLALTGSIKKENAELLLGGAIPLNIRLPDGTRHADDDEGDIDDESRAE